MHDPRLILVVDDTPADALLLSRSLSKARYDVVVAHDGDAALRVALERLPDLILLDMTMPGRDGLEICRALKLGPTTAVIPVVFVTGHSGAEHIVKAFAAGGADYVTKPIRVDEILARVSVQLRLREAEQLLEERNARLEELTESLAETNTQLALQSRTDALTHLLNRRAWDEAAQIEHERAQRHHQIYSILMLDADRFKGYNDSKGHPAGDECLRQLAQSIVSTCRGSDVVGRYGGEEFVVLAPETSAEQAIRLGERIRQGVWRLALAYPTSPAGRMTISIGVADSDAGPLKDVLKRADAALYAAKKAGRNVVCARRAEAESSAVTGGQPQAIPSAEAEAITDDLPTILIVEDNQTNHAVFRSSLSEEQYRIIEVKDDHSALAAVERERPDVILMDMMMPGMDGLECTKRLKTDPSACNVPIVIVSDKDSPADIVAGLDAGADDYMTQPVQATELLARVRSMVRLSRERRDLLRSYQLRAEQIRILSVLLDLCREFSQTTSVDRMLDHLLSAVAEVTGGRRVSIMLPDPTGRHLTIARALGIDPDVVAGVNLPVGTGIAGKVFETNEAIIVNSKEDPRYAGSPFDVGFFASVPLLATPLGAGGDVVGVLNVTERVGGSPFEARDLEYVELLASIAGSTLHGLRDRAARDEARDLIVFALAKLAEHRDTDTGKHVERVTQYAIILAQDLRATPAFSEQIHDAFIENLSRAVPLHDIGKVAIPDAILRKPGRLTLEEMAVMRTHAQIGADALAPIIARAPGVEFLRTAADIIQSHHEWFDGTGYPRGLQGGGIPLAARIVALADVYDALTTDRVYKKAIGLEDAERIIEDAAGTQFDPAIVDAFLQNRSQFRALAVELSDHSDRAQRPRPQPVVVC